MEKYDPNKLTLAEIRILRKTVPFEDGQLEFSIPAFDIDPRRVMTTRTDTEVTDEGVTFTIYLTLRPESYMAYLEEMDVQQRADAWNGLGETE